MPRNKQNEMSLDFVVRRIVREEMRTMFTWFDNEPEIKVDQSTSAVIEDGSIPKKVRRRSSNNGTGKGRVTNSSDKRLKENRTES